MKALPFRFKVPEFIYAETFKSFRDAERFCKRINCNQEEAYYITITEKEFKKLKLKWEKWRR